MTQLALITGASRGLGFALAEALSPAWHVMAVGRTVGALEELDDRIKAKGGSATLAPLDITDTGAMAHMCRSIHDRWGGLGLWLHTAVHAAPLTPTAHLDPKDWEKSRKTNVDAVAVLIPYVSPLLGTAGRAVFFDDPRGGEKFFGHYGATKAAQTALARSWQAETGKTGPRVDIVQPRPMSTATRARFYPGEDRATLIPAPDEARAILDALDLA
ncbi:SDR family NAD(P)-dependent oxidoreductase [Citreimonas sp.]|uniref:SDR family NAD(P)-dependent oxidoreductase n=1 Tax=Citreimonas sp. TaxID=3036715 RepID=UPI0040597448